MCTYIYPRVSKNLETHNNVVVCFSYIVIQMGMVVCNVSNIVAYQLACLGTFHMQGSQHDCALQVWWVSQMWARARC